MTEKTRSTREIRINPIVPSESVLVATARGMRPKKAEEPAPRDTRAHVETCPFCTGNEHMTPPEIAQFPAEGDWQVRIVENLYPVLGDDRIDSGFSFGLQQTIDGYGRHEVIIDHSQHGIAFHEMSETHIAQVFSAYPNAWSSCIAPMNVCVMCWCSRSSGPLQAPAFRTPTARSLQHR